MEEDVLGTGVLPANFAEAARKHGRHFARYLHAAKFAAGKRVLDAACGGGFGAAYLATVAQSVLGLDLDEQMIATAQGLFAGPHVQFRIHDLHQPIDFAGRFDLVTSFETLEHVRDPDRCLANLADRLTDEGAALVSVPNGTKELCEGHHKEYHQAHFSADDFRRLLLGRFAEVALFSQVYHRGLDHYLRKLTGRGRHHAANYRFVPGLLEEAKTWLALCCRPCSSEQAFSPKG